LHESGSLHGNETTEVGSAPVHPHGLDTTEVVVHWGTRQDLHAVAVLVRVGQLTVLHGLVTVLVTLTVSVRVDVLTLVLTLVLTTVDVSVTVCSWM
jgi:hypothetical protein